MSNEIQAEAPADSVIYAVVRNQAGLVWQTTTSTFVAYADANVANYAITLTEQGTSSGYYVGDFPTAITAPGTYPVVAKIRAGGTPAASDVTQSEGNIVWDGSAVAFAPTGDNLISAAYAKGQCPALVSVDPTQLDQLIAAASAAVRAYCNRDFTVKSYVEDYDLHEPTYTLPLRQRPITAIESVTLFPYEAAPQDFGGDEFITKRSGEIAFRPTANNGYGYFPQTRRGVPNVQVSYSAGYATVPADVQKATAMFVQNAAYAASRDGTLQAERLGDYNYTLRSDSPLFTVEIKALLSAYRDYVCV